MPLPQPQLQQGPLTFPWAWMTRNPHQGNWGGAGQRVVERMIVNWADYARMICQSQLCGYATVPGDGTLRRVLPFQHPNFKQLYVDEEQGISDVHVIPFGGANATKLDNGPGQAPYLVFRWAILTLVFTERRYAVTPDGGGPGLGLNVPEYQRFMEPIDKGSAEFIQLNSGRYQFDPADPTVQNAKLTGANAAFTTGLAITDAKDMLTFVWHLVPWNYIHNANGILTNILAGLNTVNNAPFLGLPAGTLLFDSHDLERKSYPVDPFNPVIFPNKQDVTNSWATNVTLIFKYRNPPTAAGAVQLGHNLAPA